MHVHVHQALMRPDPYPVEREQRPPRRKGRKRVRLLEVRLEPAQGLTPDEPFIDIAEQHYRHFLGIEYLQQTPDLHPSFGGPQPEVRGHHPQRMAVAIQVGVHRAARFVPPERQIDGADCRDGISAQHRVAAVAIGEIDGRSFGRDEAGRLVQKRKHVGQARIPERHFLQGDDVSAHLSDHLGDPVRREPAVRTERAVDIVSRDGQCHGFRSGEVMLGARREVRRPSCRGAVAVSGRSRSGRPIRLPGRQTRQG